MSSDLDAICDAFSQADAKTRLDMALALITHQLRTWQAQVEEAFLETSAGN